MGVTSADRARPRVVTTIESQLLSSSRSAGRRVCVIGAGISGLATTKVLTADGFDVVTFEQEPEIGGVWASSRTYPGLRANNSRWSYAYSDVPYPPTAAEFPTAADVRQYLAAYAATFDLASRIQLGVTVCEVSQATDGFRVTSQSADGRQQTSSFDFVVVCAGVFSRPSVPTLPGSAGFRGVLLHSSQVRPEVLEPGAHVVVIGGGKSAFDCAAWAAQSGCRTTLVCRSPHWMAPRHVLGIVRSERLFLTRAFELFLCYHHLRGIERVLHGPLHSTVRLFWAVQSSLLRASIGLPQRLVPRSSLPTGFEYIGVGTEFYEAVTRGQLEITVDEVQGVLDPSTLTLASGDTRQADVVIYATGWDLTLPFLSRDLRDAVVQNGRLHLYRHILPPRHRALGFVGFASSTANALTSEMSAHWLSDVFLGQLDPGPPEQLDAEIASVLAWSATTFPGRPHGQFVGPFVSHYLDDLLGDMSVPTRRARSLLREYCAPLAPSSYATVGEERRHARRVTG